MFFTLRPTSMGSVSVALTTSAAFANECERLDETKNTIAGREDDGNGKGVNK